MLLIKNLNAKWKINHKTQTNSKIFHNQFFRKKGMQLKRLVDKFKIFSKNIILSNKLFLDLMIIFK